MSIEVDALARSGSCAIELELIALGVDYQHSRPYLPQTCGKVERFDQTLKKWLAKQRPAPRSAWPSVRSNGQVPPPSSVEAVVDPVA